MYLSQEEYFSLSAEDKEKYDQWLESLTEDDDEPIIYPIDISEEDKTAVMTDDGYIVMQ